ncbi:Ig-like domain-containing protein [Pimelobacter simplex]|uniref:Ig-like domain-containing protein n=1 Tax=Nocardioides simplex TaxID=2045 RepID=UPI00215028EA|nr:Ig-like domain-containing protein [Pimelobacter simplex]UUW91988.1 Ig-like domain-containing protein [Pimelobacter simplex]UUW95815.1 Ig-like domain-containing protein [Pimelobacter simplex]
MSPSSRRPCRRPGRSALAAVLALPFSLALLAPLPGVTPSAGAAPGAIAAGDDWSVTTVPGGYEVTVELDRSLPIVSDAPTIEVDGASIGVATESPDGRSLSVFTADPSVADAHSVEAGWASRDATAPAARSAAVAPEASTAEALAADPSAPGPATFTESIYKFGDQSVDLAAIGGIRGEMEGKLYLPDTPGKRPVVLLLHGRHGYCYGSGAANPARWPCSATQRSIPSYLGYDGTARALASHGYAVVSISANAINANDNQLAADQGAQARGRLVLDTLDLLADANAGKPVRLHDDATDTDVTLDEALDRGTVALAERADGFVTPPEPLDDIAAADLVGRLDLDQVGLMGHSRGGEGVTYAATLNTLRAHPFGLRSVLPLAPVDFARMTVPGVAMNVVLPYCDGDVSNQQGQHMLDDSRYAFGDDSLRTGTWVMGANHNFYNTVWTPGVYLNSVSDDWSSSTARRTEPVCGTDPSVAGSSIRMTAAEQYRQGSVYMAAWFRLTVGGETAFLPMFDGTGAVPEVLDGEDVRTQATAPSSARTTVASFESTSSLIRTSGAATATVCASLAGRTVAQALPACASTSMASATVPHWTPASNGGNVPATPLTQLGWTGSSDELRVAVPTARRNVSGFERLSVKLAAAESVAVDTDLTLSVIDGKGATWSSLVSAINPQALRRLPSSATSTSASTLKKVVLQQVVVPVTDLTAAGLDLSDVREVRFAGAPASDGSTAGAAYLSDLAFERSAVGTPAVGTAPVLGVYAPYVDEGNGPGTYDIAVTLDKPADRRVTGYASLLGSTSSRAGAAMEKVVFEPGETCKVVTATLNGDLLPSATNGTSLKASVINTQGGVMGPDAVVFTTIREDDGVTSGTALPPYGVPGDVCAEHASLGTVGTVTASDPTPVPGDTITLTAGGFRAGESVTFTPDGIAPVSAVADGTGLASAGLTIPADVVRGTIAVTARAAATGLEAEGELAALDATSTTLTWSPDEVAVNKPFDLVATVAGPDTSGRVEFLDGATTLGWADVIDGIATLPLSGLKAGTHHLSAVFAQTTTAQASTSNVITFALSRGQSAIALSLSAGTAAYGTPATATVAVPGGTGGTVEIAIDGAARTYPVPAAGEVTLTLPATLGVGEHRVTAAFSGTDELAASGPITATYRVTRASLTLSTTAKAKVRRGAKLPVRVRVSGVIAGTPVAGPAQVQVAVGSGRYRTVARVPLTRGDTTIKVRAPKSRKAAYLRVRTVVPGGTTYAPAVSPVTVVVLR